MKRGCERKKHDYLRAVLKECREGSQTSRGRGRLRVCMSRTLGCLTLPLIDTNTDYSTTRWWCVAQ